MTVWQEEMVRSFDNEDGEVAELRPMPKNPLDFLTSFGNTQKLLNTETLNNSRIISVDDEFNFETILKDGEDIPDPNLQLLYANARAAEFGQRYCTELLETIASKCAVHRFTARIKEPKQEGAPLLLNYRFNLAYNPDHEITDGDVSRLSTNDLSFRFFPLQSEEIRFSVYYRKDTVLLSLKMAEELCDSLRKNYSSCVISYGDLNKSTQRQYQAGSTDYATVETLSASFRLEFPGIVETPERLEAFALNEANRLKDKYQLQVARHIVPRQN